MLSAGSSVRFLRASIQPPRDCKALPYSHLCCTQYTARHAAVWSLAFLIPWWWRSARGRLVAGRLDWNLQEDTNPENSTLSVSAPRVKQNRPSPLSNRGTAANALDAAPP